jgi:hypothetical protein
MNRRRPIVVQSAGSTEDAPEDCANLREPLHWRWDWLLSSGFRKFAASVQVYFAIAVRETEAALLTMKLDTIYCILTNKAYCTVQ